MIPSPLRVAARYLGDAGGTLSWEVHLGGDSRNWRVLGAEDGRSWSDVLKEITRAFQGIRTRHGGTVDDVSVKGDMLKVYFDYDKTMEAGDALYDAEHALKGALETLTRQDQGLEWAVHGTVDGRSNLEFKNETIEDGFDD
jgi:hypothetical protein